MSWYAYPSKIPCTNNMCNPVNMLVLSGNSANPSQYEYECPQCNKRYSRKELEGRNKKENKMANPEGMSKAKRQEEMERNDICNKHMIRVLKHENRKLNEEIIELKAKLLRWETTYHGIR